MLKIFIIISFPKLKNGQIRPTVSSMKENEGQVTISNKVLLKVKY